MEDNPSSQQQQPAPPPPPVVVETEINGHPEQSPLHPANASSPRNRRRQEEEENHPRRKEDDDDDNVRETTRRSHRSPSSPHRSRSRERRDHHHNRSSSHYRRSSRSRSRSRDRDRRSNRRRSRSRSEDRHRHHRHRRSPEQRYHGGGGGGGAGGGYRNRRRRAASAERIRMATIEDPFAKLRQAAATATTDPAAIAREIQAHALRARQTVLQQQAASAVIAASKTQREIYVGNLTPGVVTDVMLRQLFNSTLRAAFPERCSEGTTSEPVVHINMNPEGKYCFMELLSAEMASACLQLSGQIPLAGAFLSVGRPAGYVDPEKALYAAHVAAEALARFHAENQAARVAAGVASPDDAQNTPFLCVSGMLTAEVLGNNVEFAEVVADIREEFGRHGMVLRVVVPREHIVKIEEEKNKIDGVDVDGGVDGEEAVEVVEKAVPVAVEIEIESEEEKKEKEKAALSVFGKVFVQFIEVSDAKAAKAAVNGRLFSGEVVVVEHMWAEEFMKAVGQT